jgi:two-component system response regulator WspF
MRIALVNDVMMAVEAMRRVVVGTGEHQLAWIARDGEEAVALCARDTPDLILMDLIMPRMDGVEATRRIMSKTPCAIVVVTANVDENSSKVFEAMGAGALDAVNTPVLAGSAAGDGANALLAKIDTIRRLIGHGTARAQPQAPEPVAFTPTSHRSFLVTIGSSAGGPAALARVLAGLPATFPAPIVLVQHVDIQFVQGLAEWLDGQTPLHVRLAREGDQLQAGTVLLAGSENHLTFASPSRLTYTRFPTDCSYRPSIDVFFKSTVRFWPGDIIGILLTGMGRDGAEGLLALRQKGHHTIAQDQTSSAVYGMPKAAAELHAASEILALDKIGPRLINILAQKPKNHG